MQIAKKIEHVPGWPRNHVRKSSLTAPHLIAMYPVDRLDGDYRLQEAASLKESLDKAGFLFAAVEDSTTAQIFVRTADLSKIKKKNILPRQVVHR